MKNKHIISAAVFLAFLLLINLVVAQEQEARFEGNFLISFRDVDVGGSEAKYRQHYNLQTGPRLFDLNILFEPISGLKKFVDHMEVNVNHLGGDPFETMRFSLTKYGTYDFKYQRRKATYFYMDTILPVSSSDPRLSNGGDFHTFDFDRIMDDFKFKIWLHRNAHLNFSFYRFGKTGKSTTTLDVSRDEFEFDKPVEEVMNQYSISLDYSLNNITLVLEEKIREYENNYSLFLPGFSVGEDTTNATELLFFHQNMPWKFNSFNHIGRIIARPFDRLTLRAAATISVLNSEINYNERARGVGFDDVPFNYTTQGKGDIDRDIQLYDADASFILTNSLLLIGAFRYRDFQQNGFINLESGQNIGDWDFNIITGEGGIKYSFSFPLSLFGGLRYDNREVKTEHGANTGEGVTEEHPPTKQTGFFGNANWNSRAISATVDYQYGTFDNPFTLTTPTDYHRIKASARYRISSLFSFSTWVYLQRIENKQIDWNSDQNKYGIRFNFSNSRIQAYLGYNLTTVERQVDQQVTTVGFGGGENFLFPIFYEGKTHFVDGMFTVNFNREWSIGGNFIIHENKLSWPLTHRYILTFVEYHLPVGYVVQARYRFADYEENLNHYDDYEANIGEILIGYCW